MRRAGSRAQGLVGTWVCLFVGSLGGSVSVWADEASGGLHPGLHRDEVNELVRGDLGVERYSLRGVELPTAELPERFRVRVPLDGVEALVELWRHDTRAPDFRLLLQVEGGQLIDIEPPPSRTYRGRVVGDAQTLVGASLLPQGLSMRVVPEGAPSRVFVPLRLLDEHAPRTTCVVYTSLDEPDFRCGSDDLEPTEAPPVTEADGGTAGIAAPCNLTIAELAFDTDYEFYDRIGGQDEAVCMANIETGLNLTNLIYERDLHVRHIMAALILRTDPQSDFYAQWPDASDFGDMLSSFRGEWNANMGALEYDMAYYVTGKGNPEYGGLAYVGVVCGGSRYGMGLGRGSGYERIMRHELGHNWSSSHSCGAERRYIMCGNSMDAISGFNVRRMGSHRDSRGCLSEIPNENTDPMAPFARPDRVVLLEGSGSVAIPVIATDSDVNCDRLRLTDFDAVSSLGASIRVVDFVDEGSPTGLLYTPRSSLRGIDFFSYTVDDGAGNATTGRVFVRLNARSMIVYLPLDEEDGDEVDDESGFGFDGEVRGDRDLSVRSVEGRIGRAVLFEGVDGEHISLGDEGEFDLETSLALACWFRIDSATGAGETLLAKGDAWRLERDASGARLRFSIDGVPAVDTADRTLRSTTAVNDGEWHHATASWDGATMSLWIDGELEATSAASGLVRINGSSFRIGDSFTGAIDEVRLFNHGLASDDAAALFVDGYVANTEPAEGETAHAVGTGLSWVPAASATQHDVYVGTDENAVRIATTDSPEYAGRTSETYIVPDLEPETKYYWRVDEVSGGTASRGSLRSFSTAFASTNFDEPSIGSEDFNPGAGDRELGFQTTATPTGGDNPLSEVVNTSSTPSSPIFGHRSVDATTTFQAVDLSERGLSLATIWLQARSTGYEADQDFVEVRAEGGDETRTLVRLEGGPALTQSAGEGYHTYGALLPASWDSARLVVESSSNSGSGSERYDFDRVAFSCQAVDRVIASCWFEEVSPGSASFTPAAGDREIGFTTTSTDTSGVDSLAAVEAHALDGRARWLTQRSVDATTSFAAVDLSARSDVFVRVVLRVLDTGYEDSDELSVSLRNGAERVDLVSGNGASVIEPFANDDYTTLTARVPADWDSVRLVVASRTNSSSGAEGIAIRGVEFVERASGNPCDEDEPPTGSLFRRGDADSSGVVDISDGIRILNFLFAGATAITCLDAADSDDSGNLDLSDGVTIFSYLFSGGVAPAAPGPLSCGEDPTDDTLSCDADASCSA